MERRHSTDIRYCAPRPANIPRPSRRKRDGFALVIALGLMSFIFILLLSLSTLVQVETKNASTTKDQLLARQNALLGLNISLGRLQLLMGPDLRVSTSADITTTENLDVSTGSGNLPFYPENQRQWVGAWNSDPTSSNYGQLVGWLVSGQDTDNLPPAMLDEIDVKGLLSSNTSVDEAKEFQFIEYDDGVTIGGVKIDGVTAPLEFIKGNDAYAYWVSDEGMKAKINLAEGTTLPIGTAAFGTPPTNGLELLVVDESATGNDAVISAVEKSSYEQLTGVSDFDLIINSDLVNTANRKNAKEIFHDATTHSYGLLNNPATGGLKVDLSTSLASANGDAHYDSFPTSNPQIYPRAFSGSGSDVGGPEWAQLKSYYQLHNELSQDTGEYSISPRPQTSDQIGVYPIVTNFQFYEQVTLYLDPLGTDAKPLLHQMPIVVLWNPYNVTLKATDYYISNKSTGYFHGDSGEAPIVRVGIYDSANANKANQLISNNGNSSKPLINHPSYDFKIESPDIPPGRAMVFSAPVGYRPYENADSNVLVPGHNQTAGSYYHEFEPVPRPTYNPASGKYEVGARVIENLTFGRELSSCLNELSFALTPTDLWLNPLQNIRGFQTSNNWWSAKNENVINYPTGNMNVIYDFIIHSELDGAFLIEPIEDGWRSVPNSGWTLNLRFTDNVFTNFNQDRHQGDELSTRWLGNNNPRFTYASLMPLDLGYLLPDATKWALNLKGYGTLSNYVGQGLGHQLQSKTLRPDMKNRSSTAWWIENFKTYGSNDEYAYIGSSINDPVNDTTDVKESILFHIPRSEQEIQSIGDLMHANLNHVPSYEDAKQYNINNHSYPAYTIGNALSDPYLENDDSLSQQTWSGASSSLSRTNIKNPFSDTTHYDHSYLLNRELWDDYYFSTYDAATGQFSNQRMEPVPDSNGQINTSDLSQFDRAAGQLLVNGAFNVNSMSVAAWESVIGSFWSNQVLKLDGTLESNLELSPLLRVPYPLNAPYKSADNPLGDNAYSSYRNLTKSEINDLAKAIVQEIKNRVATANSRPFFTLSEFVNRSTTSSVADHRQKGLLQAAIEATTINDDFKDASLVISSNGPSNSEDFNMAAIENESTATGAPGYLMQGDLLARLGPILNVRSDTFTIRSYGQVSDPITGATGAKAMCEAVVQRMPEYIDKDGNAPYDSITSLTPENQQFGRGFKIISFRWLTSTDEI